MNKKEINKLVMRPFSIPTMVAMDAALKAGGKIYKRDVTEARRSLWKDTFGSNDMFEKHGDD